MIIVVDESLGLYEKPNFLDESISYIIYPFKTDEKVGSFLNQIERAKPSNFRASLQFKTKILRDELNFFTETILAIKNGWEGLDKLPLFYFYSPFYTNHEQVKTIQNILLPDVRVFPIPIKSDRAKALFLMKRLQQGIKLTEVYSDCLEYYYYLLSLDQVLSSYILSPKPLLQFKPKKWRYVYKLKKEGQAYQLVHLQRDGQLQLIELGSLESLWNQLIALHSETDEIWTVTRGISVTAEQQESITHLYEIMQSTIPVNIPIIDISVYTGKRDYNMAVVQT